MGETSKYKPLKDIVYMYMDEAMLTTAAFRRLWTLGVRGLEEFGLDVAGNFKTCRLCVNGNQTAELPDDYYQWSKIGTLNSSGEVTALNHNPALTNYADGSVDRLSKNTDSINYDITDTESLFYLSFINCSGFNDQYYNYYGLSGNQITKVGDFKVDEGRGIILLDNNFPSDYVILEYIAAPCNDEDYKVPIQAQEALIAWLSWRDIQQLAASRKVSVYDKTQRMRHFYNQKRIARERLKPFRISDAYQQSSDSVRLVPKS